MSALFKLNAGIENARPIFFQFHLGNRMDRFGKNPALESCAVRAMVKQPAWPAVSGRLASQSFELVVRAEHVIDRSAHCFKINPGATRSSF